MPGRRTRLRRLVAALAATCVAGACGRGDRSPEAEVDREQLYTVRCAYCHDVPNGIGEELTPGVLAAYATVGALGRYLRVAMPHENPGSLPSAEYDAILRYLLESRRLVPDDLDYRALPDSTGLRVVGQL